MAMALSLYKVNISVSGPLLAKKVVQESVCHLAKQLLKN